MENRRNTIVTEKDVRSIMGTRRLVKRSKTENLLLFSVFAIGAVLAAVGLYMSKGVMFGPGIILMAVPVVYNQFNGKRKEAERYFIEHWQATGELLPDDWRYKGKGN